MNTIDPGFIQRLCNHAGVPDFAALKQTELWQRKYSEVAGDPKNAGVSGMSLTGKTLQALRVVSGTESVKAHIFDSACVDIGKDDNGDNCPTGLGVLLKMPDDRTRFIKFRDFDPANGELPHEQHPADGYIPGAKSFDPVVLHDVSVTHNLEKDTTTYRVTKESRVELGGHDEPWGSGPDLEYTIGATAENNEKGAYYVGKSGTHSGDFGHQEVSAYESKGFPTVTTFTVTGEASDVKVVNFEDTPPGTQYVKAKVYDPCGYSLRHKIPLADISEQFGVPEDSPNEVFVEAVLGQRYNTRGRGSIFDPIFDPVKTFGGPDKFQALIDRLKNDGWLVEVGEKGNHRLDLSKAIDEETNKPLRFLTIPEHEVAIADISQSGAGTDKEKWEFKVYCGHIRKDPWFSTTSWQNEDQKGNVKLGNPYAFIRFENAVDAGGELAEDDPWMQAALELEGPAPQNAAAPTE